MKVATIKDLENLADGTTIGEMRVNVKKVFPPRTGKGKFGDWKVQNAIVEDSTGEVRAAFWIPDGIDDLQGQTITIRSRASKKGLAGLTVQFSDHSKANELKITENAAIIDDAGAAVESFSAPVAKPAGRPAPVQAGNPADARKYLFQVAQLMVEAIKASHWVGEQVKLTPEQLQAVASSIFISGDRAGLAKVFPASTKVETTKEEPEQEEESDDIGF
jgi:hypothetical protein